MSKHIIRLRNAFLPELRATAESVERLGRLLSAELLEGLSDRFETLVEGGACILSPYRDLGVAGGATQFEADLGLPAPMRDFCAAVRALDRDLEAVLERHADLVRASHRVDPGETDRMASAGDGA